MLYVDPDICTGCGICVNVCPDGFAMENGLARVKDASASCAAEARDVCPVSAIRDGDTPAEKSASAERPAERSPRGEGSGGGRGLRGRGRGRGRSAYCVCPVCGRKEPHLPGNPCAQQRCPECGARMTR